MINLRILLGWVPKTAEYEANQVALRKEFSELTAFSQSKELAEYIELEKTILSSEFALRKKRITGSRFSDTPEYSKEKEYLALKKRREIQRYYKTKNSVELKDFLEFDRSYDVKHYHTLEKLVQSDEFTRMQKERGRRKFKTTPEYEKYLEFKSLKKSERMRDYFRFKLSRDYVNFTLLIGSEKIAAYEQLDQYIRSDEFKKVKEYMLLPGRKKLEMSEEFRSEQKYKELKNSEKFKWYLNTRNSKKFDEIKRWNLTFSDEFDTHKLDRIKWLTRYFWGEKVLHDSYVNDTEKQFFTEEKNMDIANSVLTIHTRKEKITGKSWNPAIGFYSRNFDYSSGIINSGVKFRQQYGLFEVKIRFNLNQPVNHAVWMISELMLPHINIARADKKISVGNFWGNPNVKGGVDKNMSSMSRNRYGQDFQIFSLEWTKDKLVWKINGITVRTANQGVPQVPMFINISSSLYQDVNGSVLPASVEVDWIRCYQPL
jgi:beta-glucanase (GH16 family)